MVQRSLSSRKTEPNAAFLHFAPGDPPEEKVPPTLPQLARTREGVGNSETWVYSLLGLPRIFVGSFE